MFPDRPTKRSVLDENDAELDPESVLIIRPYDEEFGTSERTSTLLVNAAQLQPGLTVSLDLPGDMGCHRRPEIRLAPGKAPNLVSRMAT